MPRSAPLRREPRQARAVERLERVLDTAEAVFVQVGYENATTNQIAAQAGTSIGSLYEFFPNKQAVAHALADRYRDRLGQLYDSAVVNQPGQPRETIVNDMANALDGFYRAHPAMATLLRGNQGNEELRVAGQQLHSSLVDHVERIIEDRRHDLPHPRAAIVARVCAEVIRGLLDVAMAMPEADHRVLVEEMKSAVLGYLSVALPRREDNA